VPITNRYRIGIDLSMATLVPYNPYLSRKYHAHINVEICSSVRAIKYIHKYIYKGTDRSTIQLSRLPVNDEHDEISQHLQGRYIGPCEAIWQLFVMRPLTKQVRHMLQSSNPVSKLIRTPFPFGSTRDAEVVRYATQPCITYTVSAWDTYATPAWKRQFHIVYIYAESGILT